MLYSSDELTNLVLQRPFATIGLGLLAVLLATPLLGVLLPVGKMVVLSTVQAFG